MSDTAQGPGWWMASDGRWYPPESRPAPPPPAGYPMGAPGLAYQPAPSTNGLAVASLVCSCAGFFFFGLPSIVGIVLGFVARSQISRANGRESGSGMALAGIIVGFAAVAIVILTVVLIIVLASHATFCTRYANGDSFNCSAN